MDINKSYLMKIFHCAFDLDIDMQLVKEAYILC
jgi:hypothetical protein